MDSEAFSSAAEWAERVRPVDPHGFRELEQHVLGRAPDSDTQRRGAPEWSAAGLAQFTLFFLALFGVVGAATVFWDRSEASWFSSSFSNQVAFPVACLGFVLGSSFVVVILVEWARSERRRDGALAWLSASVAGCAVLTLLSARGETPAGTIPGELYLLPVRAGLGLGLLGVALGAAERPLGQLETNGQESS